MMAGTPPTVSGSSPIAIDSAISLKRSLLKMFVTAILVMGSVALIHLSPVGEWMGDVQYWKMQIADRGPLALMVFCIASTLLVAGGLPRLLMSAVAGGLFGFKIGFPIAWLTAAAGAYLNFVLIRWGARDVVRRLIRVPSHMQAALYHPGLLTVAMVRQLPMWGLAQNAALALTEVKPRLYVWGTLLGIMPSTLVMSLIGSGIGKASLEDAMRNIVWAMIAMGAIGALMWYVRRRWRIQ